MTDTAGTEGSSLLLFLLLPFPEGLEYYMRGRNNLKFYYLDFDFGF